MSDDLKAVMAAFDRNLWEGLDAYANYRKAKLLKEGADGKDWDAVVAAKGARHEIEMLFNLRTKYETYIADRKAEAARRNIAP